MAGRETLREDVPREAPQPPWAVALDKMRTFDGGKPEADVMLTPDDCFAFVQHYLRLSTLLDVTEVALRERNARLDHIERLARGEGQ